MSSMSHTYGNVLAWIQKTVLDIMPEDLFMEIVKNERIAQYIKEIRK